MCVYGVWNLSATRLLTAALALLLRNEKLSRDPKNVTISNRKFYILRACTFELSITNCMQRLLFLSMRRHTAHKRTPINSMMLGWLGALSKWSLATYGQKKNELSHRHDHNNNRSFPGLMFLFFFIAKLSKILVLLRSSLMSLSLSLSVARCI